MSVHCPLCHDGWLRIWAGDCWLHELPEPAGMFRCEAADADRPPPQHPKRNAA